jgi:hypothetical protein
LSGRPDLTSIHPIVVNSIYFPWLRSAAGTATTIAGIGVKLNHKISETRVCYTSKLLSVHTQSIKVTCTSINMHEARYSVR